MALLLMAVSETRRAPRCQWARIAWRYSLATAVSLTGLAAFALYCQRRYHDLLAFAHIQSHYNRTLKATIRYQSANGFIHASAARLLRGRKFTAITATSLAMMAMEAFLYSRGNAHY